MSTTTSHDFHRRHIGPNQAEVQKMLDSIGYKDIDTLMADTVPDAIRHVQGFDMPEPLDETEALRALKDKMSQNKVYRSLIGMGYYDTKTPMVIARNILENPSWYTQYTPYQAEIAQGRLEALLNFQTMITDLTGLHTANASLLDEATAAAEAMFLAQSQARKQHSNKFIVYPECFPQTLAVLQTRAQHFGIEVVVADNFDSALQGEPFGVYIQYPDNKGQVHDVKDFINRAKAQDMTVVIGADLLSLCLLTSPGELGADIAVGSTQRFGIPLGYGGPHAGYIAVRSGLERKLPGRIVGVSKDSTGKVAYRLALATREQHIRRDKATSNICTSQVLLAIMAGMYAVYHGRDGLTTIANRIHAYAQDFYTALSSRGYSLGQQAFFDTLTVTTGTETAAVLKTAHDKGFNLRQISSEVISIAFDEKTNAEEVTKLLTCFEAQGGTTKATPCPQIPETLKRQSDFLSHPVFHSHQTETKLMRYIKKLERRDLSLTHSMIPLGSCTMKLNAAAELAPVSWPEVNQLHPFAPIEQAKGYQSLFKDLEKWLAQVTGLAAVSLQPNSGAQGEYTGLLAIKRYHDAHGQNARNICLIPRSAHGTNPASAAMAGFKIVGLKCDERGEVDIDDLRAKLAKHTDQVAALMITYPSTHGVFEENVQEICQLVKAQGGLVYMDGANLQAQIGLCTVRDIGADVCHLNLHKTFCIPHGGGGPGMGPIAVSERLQDYLPAHPLVDMGIDLNKSLGTVSAAPWGSSSILPISWMYMRMMGSVGLQQATKVAILSANYLAHRLSPHYPIVYTGHKGRVAHECIIDLKVIKKATGIDEAAIARRLMDYGYHAPTMSWPVPASMMIEPTESESLDELDRFCEAMIQIRHEISLVESGEYSQSNNPVSNAPHTASHISSSEWDHPYSRETAAFPLSWVTENKFWPFVGKIDNAYGDRNLVCSCPSVDAFES